MALLNRGIIFFVVVVLAAAELVGNAAAVTYVVGDSLGWRVPPGGAADYATWASQHTFRVGDVLVFNFNTGFHTAAKVGQGAYDGCTSTNPIALATVGPASFVLNSTGPDFYICTFGQHCSLGQKLAINVTSSSTTPTPAPLRPPTVMPPSSAPAQSPPTVMPPSSAPPQSPPTAMPPSSAPAQSPPTVMPPSSAPALSPPTVMPPSSAPALSQPIGAPSPTSSSSSSSSSPAPTPHGLSPSSFPVGDLNPLPSPPPSSAAVTTIHAPPIIVFVWIIFGFVI